MSSVGSEVVRIVSTCTIKPQCIIEETQEEFNLTPWDLSFLSAEPIQKGLLFAKTPSLSDHENPMNSMIKIIEQLKNSLSLTLSHFYPLCGHLSTRKQDDPPSYTVFLDCSDSQGAEFIYAIAENVTVADILNPLNVPPIVRSFFALNGSKNHDGHTQPLLAVQVTELVDGYFIGCSFNHVVGDGTSFWHFFSTWAEICRTKGNVESISTVPPITERWFSEEEQQQEDYAGFNLPFSHHDEFIERTIASPPLSKRIFHFSAQSIAQLKTKANSEACTNKISSLQALSALVWRSVTRVLGVHEEQETACRLLVNDRLRLNPPLSIDYFGCSAGSVAGIAKSGELLGHELGWAAWLLHEAVASRTDDKVRQWLNNWLKNPSFLPVRRVHGQTMVSIGSSPRFDMYGCEFGWGKAIAVRSGSSVNYSGNVWLYPGREGGGSVDLELCLPQETMSALESDEEFTSSH
ncbi:hypothetical protein MKW98_004138 [Papaver atlanticum]|uniref:HXXXD-type acyl-transferase family protein n=1 Tax=Papaver atlanticum TaxID=357466 RepID=A0AAD4T0P4_9MAGN|nr:hypothetical protein MKW98_004138 [Papaver atlanticum]